MRIVEVTESKKQYLDLLLLADEQEDMVDRYLYNGKMYVLDDDGVKCECVVTDEGNGILEIKNIATVPPFQRKGYAKALIEFLVEKSERAPAWAVLRECPHEQVQRGVGIWRAYLRRHGCGDQARQVEELQTALFF